jgi:hypothetical protein
MYAMDGAKIILALIAGLAFAASPLTSKAEIGVTTAAQFEAQYGKPYLADNSQVDARMYLHGNSFVAALYDETGTVQAVAYYKIGTDGFNSKEAQAHDWENLPGGTYNWISVPTDKMYNPYSIQNVKMWEATTANAMLFVIGGRMIYDGMPITMRAYATAQGCLMLGKLPENWGDAFANAPKQKL